MPIQIGQRIPDVTLKTKVDGKVCDLSTADLCRGRKVVLFAVPGAYTSTCSERHLPGFVDRAADILTRADVLALTAVNDIHVLTAWTLAHDAGPELRLLADGNGDFARAMGLELDARAFGLGIRSQRYAAIFEDGVLTMLGKDVPGEVKDSGAEAVLAALGT